MAEDATITADDLVDTKVIAPPAAGAPAADSQPAKPASPAPGASAAPATVLDDDDAAKPAPAAAVPADWPADWREKAAAGDEKKLARLARYASPQALADALIAAQTKIASGTNALPKDATPEEVKMWRDSVGIPETPDKYELGREIDEASKPIVDKYLATAHATNQTPEQVKATLAAFYEAQQAARDARVAEDHEITQRTQEALIGEWGNEYRRDINIIRGFLDTAPAEVKDRLIAGRMSDGTPVMSDPGMLKWMLSLALERNPAGIVVPGGSGDPLKGLEDEINAIEKVMRTDRTQYNRDEKMQTRYRDLIDARAKMSQRAA